ncbi:MAG: VOC family protein [Dehalococcoidia bacterium]
MALLRMDNVNIVVEDLDAAVAFFVALGMEFEGRQDAVEGPWVDGMIALDHVRVDIAMLRMPDGQGRVELSTFHTPAAVAGGPAPAPANTLGMRRIMFAVDDIEAILERLRAHGAEVVGEIVQYEQFYRLCNVRGPEGITIALAQPLT